MLHRSLRSCVVYTFSCAGCKSVYTGETTRHLSTRVREHLYTDKNSHIFKHLNNSPSSKSLCIESFFKVLDSANNYHNSKIKEALHIMWERPNLNKNLQYYNTSLSFYYYCIGASFFFRFFHSSFQLIYSIDSVKFLFIVTLS